MLPFKLSPYLEAPGLLLPSSCASLSFSMSPPLWDVGVQVHCAQAGSQLMCCALRYLVLRMHMCRFTALQSFNGATISAEEVAAAGRLLGVMEAALDAALVSNKHLPYLH